MSNSIARKTGRRRWILGLFIAGFVWLVVSRLAEVEEVARTLARGQWEWVLMAAFLQGIYYYLYASVYQSAFDTVEVRSRIRELLPLWFASLFINLAAPTAGPALFIDDAARRGQSGARAAAGTILVRVADLGTFLLVLVAGLGYLFTRHDLRPFELAAAAILLGIVGSWAGVLFLGLSQPERLRRLLGRVQRTLNGLASRFMRPAPLAGDWADRSVTEFAQAAAAIATHPRRLLRTLLLSLAAHLLDLASLHALFLAFHQSVGLGVLVAGFAVGILFWIVSITPEGVGVVEGMMALVYTSLGVPASRATVIALAFRGLTFWLPLLLGIFFLGRLRSMRQEAG